MASQLYQRISYDSPELEFKILSYMIMNKEVCDAAARRYKSGDLKSKYFSQYNKRVFQWVIRYYEKTGEPPKRGITDIWENKKKTLSSSAQKSLEIILEDVANLYVAFEEEGYNARDVIIFDIPNFIRKEELDERMAKAQLLMDRGEIDKAAELMATFKDVDEDEVEDEEMGTYAMATVEEIERIKGIPLGEIAYKFHGDLNHLVGPLRKSWLVAVMATEKTGKSFLLDEIGWDAAVYQNKKVLKVNLELSEPLQRARIIKRMSRTVDTHQAGDLIYPILDCENNQRGTCQVKSMERRMKRKEPLLHGDETVSFMEHRNWTTCDRCHNNPRVRKNATYSKRFQPTVWFDHSRVKPMRHRYSMRAAKKFDRFGRMDNFRIRCFPRFSRTFDEIRDYIMRYIEKFKWQPDIILLDYVDIMAQSDSDIRLDTDRKWKQASQLAGELNCLVINADQANKSGRGEYQLNQQSTTESKTKDAHLDVKIALNQTDGEKKLGIARIGIVFHRHQDFAISNEVLITQRLATSEPILENTRIWGRRDKYQVVQEF